MSNSSLRDPRFLKALRNLEEAIALQRQGLVDEAEKAFARLVKKNPDYFDALHFYGLFKYQRGQFNDAARLIAKATKINPRSANAFSSLGVVLAHLGRQAEALASLDAALKLEPDHLQTLSNRCNILNELGRYDDTIASSDRVLKINPNYPDVYVPRGEALYQCHRDEESLASYDRALRLNPNSAMAWVGRGKIFSRLKRHAEALAAYEKALTLKSDIPQLEGARLHTKMHLCDWRDFDRESSHLVSSVGSGLETAPFYLLAISSSPELQLQCAKLFIKKRFPSVAGTSSQHARYDHDRMRVAYLSADFGEHPVSYLLAGVFEQHDRSRFETFAISLKRYGESAILARLRKCFDHFIDVEERNDKDVAELLRALEIDIAVDLVGYTESFRPGILARRPSPIQINYLGYPGTMGADHIDYIVADGFTIPEMQRRLYSEKIIYLPETFQANDSKREIAATPASRAAVGLPAHAFVFCSFNNSYKITPEIFEIWTRILKQTDGSVLWLLGGDVNLERNLRREAETRNVNPERLIFAPRMPYANHLARYRLADLFLDTFPFNAGTTASDALWAGLPVITCPGEGFASRMAGSLLTAVGLPEMIAGSMADYEALACKLAHDPDFTAVIRKKLEANITSCPLFNTELFTRRLEAAYAAVYERYLAKLPPDHIHVPQ